MGIFTITDANDEFEFRFEAANRLQAVQQFALTKAESVFTSHSLIVYVAANNEAIPSTFKLLPCEIGSVAASKNLKYYIFHNGELVTNIGSEFIVENKDSDVFNTTFVTIQGAANAARVVATNSIRGYNSGVDPEIKHCELKVTSHEYPEFSRVYHCAFKSKTVTLVTTITKESSGINPTCAFLKDTDVKDTDILHRIESTVYHDVPIEVYASSYHEAVVKYDRLLCGKFGPRLNKIVRVVAEITNTLTRKNEIFEFVIGMTKNLDQTNKHKFYAMATDRALCDEMILARTESYAALKYALRNLETIGDNLPLVVKVVKDGHDFYRIEKANFNGLNAMITSKIPAKDVCKVVLDPVDKSINNTEVSSTVPGFDSLLFDDGSVIIKDSVNGNIIHAKRLDLGEVVEVARILNLTDSELEILSRTHIIREGESFERKYASSNEFLAVLKGRFKRSNYHERE